MYNEKVMNEFSHPKNVGVLEDANAIGQVGSAACGDIMKMYLRDNCWIIWNYYLIIKTSLKNFIKQQFKKPAPAQFLFTGVLRRGLGAALVLAAVAALVDLGLFALGRLHAHYLHALGGFEPQNYLFAGDIHHRGGDIVADNERFAYSSAYNEHCYPP